MTESATEEALVVLLLDVRQGDAAIVLLPDGSAVVFDCRDDHVVDRHLRDFGVERIEAVIISHLDWDHIAGAKQLLTEWRNKVTAVYINTDERALSDDANDNRVAKALIDYVIQPVNGEERVPWRIQTPEADVVVVSGDRWQISLLAPAQRLRLRDERKGRLPNPNERSAVLQISHTDRNGGKSHRVLVGADAPLVTWAEVSHEDLPANVFRTPHHGGSLDDGGVHDGWTAARLYDAVGPTNAVISVGTDNRHGHPDPLWCEPLVERPGCTVR